jgi:hypothetical protein
MTQGQTKDEPKPEASKERDVLPHLSTQEFVTCLSGLLVSTQMPESVRIYVNEARSRLQPPSIPATITSAADEPCTECARLAKEITRITRGDVSNIITTLGDALTYIGQLERARASQRRS